MSPGSADKKHDGNAFSDDEGKDALGQARTETEMLMKIIRIQKAPDNVEAKYVALTESGQLIDGFADLEDIKDRYRYEIRAGLIKLRRELNHVYGDEITDGEI